jgi:septal ring factor EnvC (AmiA/AmiB activator)
MWAEPAVVAGLVSLLVAVLAPYVSERIRQRSQVRRDDAAVTVRRMDGQERFYTDLQARLEATESENDELGEKVLRLERVVMGWETRFATIADDLDRIRAALEAERPEVRVAIELLVQMLDKVRRREDAIQGREA